MTNNVSPCTENIHIIDQHGRIIGCSIDINNSLYDQYCYKLKGLSQICIDCPVGILSNTNGNIGIGTNDIIDINLNKQGYIINFSEAGEKISPIIINVGNSHSINNLTQSAERTVAMNNELERELELGGRLQSSLIPDKWKDPVVNLELVYRPLAKVSGDIFDIYKHGQKGSFFLIADVSGHGVASALIMALLKSYVFQHLMTSEMINLTEFASYLNKELSNLVKSGDFITMFMGYIHSDTLLMNYVCFGHPSPIIVRKNTISEMKISTNVPLLMINDFEFSMSTFQMEEGDVFVLYTDGVTECQSPEGTLLGILGLKNIIDSVLDKSDNSDNSKLADKVFRSLSDYSGMAMYNDDITIACLTINNKFNIVDEIDEINNNNNGDDEKKEVNIKDLEDLF